MNTTLAACTGGIAAISVMYWQTPRSWDTTGIINGFLAGLVIACPCYWVSDVGACVVGAVAGVIVILAMELLEHLRIDDRVGAWPVHGACGIWGTLRRSVYSPRADAPRAARARRMPTSSVTSRMLDELVLRRREGDGSAVHRQPDRLCRYFASAMAMFGALNAFGLLRVSKEGELIGLNLNDMESRAYPRYTLSASSPGRNRRCYYVHVQRLASS